MTEFLSEAALLRLKERVRDLRLRLSILQKSVCGINTENIDDIIRQKLPNDVKREAVELLSRIKAAELFLSSFGAVAYPASSAVTRQYGSTGALLNLLFRLGMGNEYGYLFVTSHRGRISARHSLYPYVELWGGRFKPEVLLAVDINEHAFYLDYGFDKRAYLYAALPYLDLARLDRGE